jgi:quercetin dioxygenase-like cupin family protein
MHPYNDLSISPDSVIREFDQNIDAHELMWHRDLQDRTVTVLEGDGWFFQLDNQLPVELKQDTSVFIPKMQWHRVLKGTSTLKLQIQE